MVLVETFEQLETSVGPDGTMEPECDERALELIDKLGLTGQKELNTPRSGDSPHRLPYREMTDLEHKVYEALCDRCVKANEYKAGPIPVRVLEVMESTRDMFDMLEIRYVGSSADKDPVLIGVRTDPSATWRQHRFLLARWGEELQPFDTLFKKAARAKRELHVSKLTEIEAAVTARLAFLKDEPDASIVSRMDPYFSA